MESIIAQMLINGLLLAGIYAVVTAGLNIIYGVIRIVNFCHGELLTLSLYISYWLYTLFGIHPYLSIPVTCVILFIIGMLIQAFIIEGMPHESQGVITLALYMILQGSFLLFWASDYRTVSLPVLVINIMGVYISFNRFIILIAMIIMTILFYSFLFKTKWGISLRAVVQDPEIAEWQGINVKKVRILSFGIGALLAGFAGALLIPVYYVYPGAGLSFALIGWAVMVLGGLGNFAGAFLGSLILGFTESIVSTLYNADLARAISLTVFFIILLIKPQGLLVRRG